MSSDYYVNQCLAYSVAEENIKSFASKQLNPTFAFEIENCIQECLIFFCPLCCSVLISPFFCSVTFCRIRLSPPGPQGRPPLRLFLLHLQLAGRGVRSPALCRNRRSGRIRVLLRGMFRGRASLPGRDRYLEHEGPTQLLFSAFLRHRRLPPDGSRYLSAMVLVGRLRCCGRCHRRYSHALHARISTLVGQDVQKR